MDQLDWWAVSKIVSLNLRGVQNTNTHIDISCPKSNLKISHFCVCVCVNFPLNKRIYFSIKNHKDQYDLSSKSPGKKREERDGKRPKCITRKGSKDHIRMHDYGGSQLVLFLVNYKIGPYLLHCILIWSISFKLCQLGL